MPRRLFNLVAVLSLVLCVATVVVGVRSYWLGIQIGYQSPGPAAGWQRQWSVGCYSGRLPYIRPGWLAPGQPAEKGWFAHPRHARPGYHIDGVAGFERRTVTAADRWLSEVRFPIWILTAVFALAPAVALQRLRRRLRRATRGQCPRCGYDLRATPGRCPECGDAAGA